jgi:hypothetical protein
MNDNEREMDLALAEAEQENRLLRARNERLERELAGQVALNKMAENARELGLNYDTPLSAFVRSSDEDKAEVMERVIDKAIEAQKEKIGCVNHDCDQCKAVQEQVALELERIAQEPPVNGNNLAQARVLMAAQRIRNTTPPAAPAVWKWHQAPVKTSWGHDMVVADLAIDKDNTVSVYCERDQTAKVEAMFNLPAAQPAVQEGRDWSLLEATQESLREHMAEIKRLKAAQPAPVMTDEKGRPLSFWGGKSVEPIAQPAPVQGLPFGVGGGLVAIKTLLGRDPCVHANTAIEMIDAILKEHPVAPKPWVGLTDGEMHECAGEYPWTPTGLKCARAIEAKLKEKNT